MKKIIFVHIPRTGGGTFSQILKEWYPKHWIRTSGYRNTINPEKSDVICGHFRFQPEYKKYFVCTFIRYPYDWYISRWLYHNELSNNKIKSPLDMKNADFGPLQQFASENSPRYATWSRNNVQSFYFNNAKISDFDFIGITDKYKESVERFKTLYGETRDWNHTYKKNSTKKENIKIKPEWKERILKKSKNDLKLYNSVVEKFYK
jgi:hypothetical protein